MEQHTLHSFDIIVQLFAQGSDLIISLCINLGSKIASGDISYPACHNGNRLQILFDYEEQKSGKTCKADKSDQQAYVKRCICRIHDEAVGRCTGNDPGCSLNPGGNIHHLTGISLYYLNLVGIICHGGIKLCEDR